MSVCKQCGWWDRLCHCKELEIFNTPKDKLFEFVDNKNFRTPTEVRGKKHWKKLLKEHGLTDDVDKFKENDYKHPFNDYKPVGQKFIRNEILKELQEKGLRYKLFKRR